MGAQLSSQPLGGCAPLSMASLEGSVSHRSALLILDAQVNMFDEAFPVYAPLELLEVLISLISRAHTAGAPVVYVQNCGGPGDPDQPGTPGWEVHPGILQAEGDLSIQKSSPDAFEGTELRRELDARGVKGIILAGMQTELCIAATCHKAADLGYQVTLVADGHSTFDIKGQVAAETIERHNRELATCARVARAEEVWF